MNEASADEDAVSKNLPWHFGPAYTDAQLEEYYRQKPFYNQMITLLNEYEYTKAVVDRDTDRLMEISKIYVDKWLEFDPVYPGLSNFFQADYWFNRLTGGLVRHKRFDEAKHYLDIYFGREWDKLYFASKKSVNATMRKRHARVTALVNRSKG
ncbi:hypothetical protein ACGYLO_10710 [Sulfitobacter sp. 1A13353]|uniref:hypothetical protein n=1 Tax=Sulfitobacter sp. 1A13353 TaxID=3368568 RepID=UPI0037469EB3